MSDPNEIYFRMCWMTLKNDASSKLRNQMDKVEISVCGLTPKYTKKELTKKFAKQDELRAV